MILTSLNPDDFYLITDPDSPVNETVLDHNQLTHASLQSYLIFEPLVEDREQDIAFYADHNEISIYTWGDSQCCLPKGANSATLLDPGTATPPKPEQP